MILSSETLNVEPTVASPQENAIPHESIIAQEIDNVDVKLNDLHIERGNLNSKDTDKSDKSEQDELDAPKTETQLPPPILVDSIRHEQDTSGEKISDDHM